MASTIPSTVLSKSAESNTITGDLPPNSKDSFFPLPAVALRKIWPTYNEQTKKLLHYHCESLIIWWLKFTGKNNILTEVDPVNPTLSTVG